MLLITLGFEQKIYFELRKIYLNWGFSQKGRKKNQEYKLFGPYHFLRSVIMDLKDLTDLVNVQRRVT